MEQKLIELFEKSVYPEPNTGCWIWGASLSRGYGLLSSPEIIIRAHRFSYLHFKGPIPEGLHVCHSCDNKWCVNPDHLWIGTKLENEQDKKAKNRHKPRFRMRCRNGHPFEDNLYVHNGKNKCRACENERKLKLQIQ